MLLPRTSRPREVLTVPSPLLQTAQAYSHPQSHAFFISCLSSCQFLLLRRPSTPTQDLLISRFTSLATQVWSVVQEHQHPLGACQKGRTSGSTQTYWIRSYILTRSPVDSQACTFWEIALSSRAQQNFPVKVHIVNTLSLQTKRSLFQQLTSAAVGTKAVRDNR